MKITALEIKQHEFEKSFRGYNIEEVDIFLNNLASEWERTSNEAKMLRMQLEIAEKEAAKLREVEMSLIKTLQNAEITSNKITEQAQNEADKKVESAKLEAQRILENANNNAAEIIITAENKVSENLKNQIQKEADIKNDIADLESYKLNLVNQLKGISSETIAKIDSLSPNVEFKSILANPTAPEIEEVENLTEAVATSQEDDEIEEPSEGIASSANTMVLGNEKIDDLTVIEGIGPKISDLLKSNNIISFRELATTPAYKIKELLGYAGSNFSMHDPSTWAEQAILADSGKWDELDLLKEKLVGGKVEVKTPTPAETQEQVTEEMLDRVNKVKAALKKAMLEKEGTSIAEAVPKVKTINDIAAEKAAESGGSFFDNLG
jgi:DivIVA domain-containing protein